MPTSALPHAACGTGNGCKTVQTLSVCPKGRQLSQRESQDPPHLRCVGGTLWAASPTKNDPVAITERHPYKVYFVLCCRDVYPSFVGADAHIGPGEFCNPQGYRPLHIFSNTLQNTTTPRTQRKKPGTFVSGLCWRRPIFPCSLPQSIVGADELNYCVRNGNRWTLVAKNTNYLC